MPDGSRRQDGLLIRLMRTGSALAFVAAIWLLPEGDTWWVGAAAALGLTAWIARGRFGSPAGVWLGLAVFAGVVPWIGMPYRREALMTLLVAGVVLAGGVAWWRHRRNPSPKAG